MRIILEFMGGCLHGSRLDGRTDSSGDQERIDYAAAYYQLTDGGQPGQRFWVISDSSRQALGEHPAMLGELECSRHYYEMISRLEDNGHVFLRAQFVGSVQPAGEAGI